MKDLTHYFNSPKEDVTASTGEEKGNIVDNANKADAEEKSPVLKKRKVNLSKRKAKVSPDVNKSENSICNGSSKHSDSTEDTNSDSSNRKKRRLKEHSSNSLKKSKPNKSTKSNNQPHNEFSCEPASNNNTIALQENSVSEKGTREINKDVVIPIDSSNSCEESIFVTKKTKPSRRILESDEEVSLDKVDHQEECIKKTDPQTMKNKDKCTNKEVSPSNTRNSLFGYFNKVDKETALKQKSEKIKVEVLVHLPPSEDGKIRKSLGKPVDVNLKKQKKKKSILDNSDTIEVISSESIVDENSSVTANSNQDFSDLALDVNNGVTETPNINETSITATSKITNLASIFLPKKTEKSVVNGESKDTETNENLLCIATETVKKDKQAHNILKKTNKKCKEQFDVEQCEKTTVTPKITGPSLLNSSNDKTIEKPIKSNVTPISQSKCRSVKIKVSKCESTENKTENNKVTPQKSSKSLNKLVTKAVFSSKNDDLSVDKSDAENRIDEKLLHKCEVVVDNSESSNAQTVLRLSNRKKHKDLQLKKSKISSQRDSPVGLVSLVNDKVERTIKDSTEPSIIAETPSDVKLDKTKKKDTPTPKSKPVTLNGYFTPKTSSLSDKNKNSTDRKDSNKGTPTWTMKVRLSNTEKPIIGSEENSVEFVEEFKQLSSQNEGGSREVKGVTESGKTTVEKVKKSVPAVGDEAPSLVEDSNLKEASQSTLNNRPKRSCRLKIKQESPRPCNGEFDGDLSDSSQGAKSKRKSIQRSAKKPKPLVIEDEDDNVVEIKLNGNTEIPKPVKIWPFFNKKEARQQKQAPVDEEKLKAKQMFLESGVPEIIKRKVESNKNEIAVGSPAPFPTVSHVTQADNEEKVDVDTDYRLPSLRCPSPPLSELKTGSFITADDLEDPDIPVFERPENVKAVLKSLKEEEPKTEVKALYKRLKVYRGAGSSDIWTEVYKPTTAADMVGNSESIKKLKSWLEVLKNRRSKEGSDSSGDEFVDSESDEESSSNNNMAILSGPCGCGKTSAVYAVAKELDCKVLEINASCNRSGKRVLAEFSESTQSHQVKRAPTANELFDNQLKGSSKKKKKWKLSKEAKSEKTSLILVEDADLLFTDVDEGFMSSLSSLAAASKRPIVLITNHDRNPHLERFQSNRLLRLNFSRPKAAKLSLWLRLVALVEGVIMTHPQAAALVSWAHCDVRRCLLQLQLMVHSNNSEIKRKVTEGQLWWLWPDRYHLKYELPSLLVQEETQESADCSDKQLIMAQLDSVAKTTNHLAYLDVLSTYTSQVGRSADEDPCPKGWRPRWRDGTSLVQCSEDPPSGITEELSEWLARGVTREWNSGGERVGQTLQEGRWLSVLRQGELTLLSGVSTGLHTDHRSVTCDYLPTLRNLARSERVRLANYTRRADRFFNYLQGLGITASKPCRDFMCDVFS